MFCQKCGNKISEDALFCPKCGNKIAAEKTYIELEEVSEPKKEIPKTVDSKKTKLILVGVLIVAVLGIFLKCIGGLIGGSAFSNYKICPDLEMVQSYVNDNKGYFMVKNTGEKTIRDFSVVYIGHDSNGNMVKSGYNESYGTIKCDSANILPGDVYGLGREYYLTVSGMKYVSMTVSEVVYDDGSTWSTKGLDAWAKDAGDIFSVEEYKQKIENMKTDALLAEVNPYAEITRIKKTNENQYSDEDDLDITLKNIGNQTIKRIEIIIAEYDKNGYGVGINFPFVTVNTKAASISNANLPAGTQGSWGWSLFFEPTCSTSKGLVYQVELEDGTVWTNEHALHWMLYHQDRR